MIHSLARVSPILRSLLDNEHQKSVELQQDDQTVLAGEENVHVTDDSISEIMFNFTSQVDCCVLITQQ